ncbi:hypothetical protein HPB47_007988 [Ixodes persulcatus]|uniref:Uncharacterized protein n=1 Tax=Ixodes persulcatus TaxID=34615 RepID=A0AC60P6B6_IXOPE|nr:hypothetical protein HPB47_007988 [Ixodes persulcatus]
MDNLRHLLESAQQADPTSSRGRRGTCVTLHVTGKVVLHIFCLDGARVMAGHTLDDVAFGCGLETCLMQPSMKGQCPILTHVGSEDGYAGGYLDILHGKKSGDNHEGMDGTRFEDRFDQVLEKLPTGGVVVVDEAAPTTGVRKKAVQQWLTVKGISRDAEMTENQLLDVVAPIKPQFVKYQVNTDAGKAGCTVAHDDHGTEATCSMQGMGDEAIPLRVRSTLRYGSCRSFLARRGRDGNEFRHPAEGAELAAHLGAIIYERMVMTLEQCEFAISKSQQVLCMNQAEMKNYKQLYSEIGACTDAASRSVFTILHPLSEIGIANAQKKIVANKQELQKAKSIRKNKQEYDALAKVIGTQPDRRGSLSQLEALEREIRGLDRARQALDSRLEQRRRQFHVLLSSVCELQQLLKVQRELLDVRGRQEIRSRSGDIPWRLHSRVGECKKLAEMPSAVVESRVQPL